MTVVSRVVMGAAFLGAVGLLLFAGIAIGWVLPGLLARRRERPAGIGV